MFSPRSPKGPIQLYKGCCSRGQSRRLTTIGVSRLQTPTQMTLSKQIRFTVPNVSEVSALFLRPENARWLLALAHGAGAGMTHPFLEKLARELIKVAISTLFIHFLYV